MKARPSPLMRRPAVAAGARRYDQLEAAALATPGIAFVGLRYGFFYGPGTWFHNDGDMGDQVRQQRVPVISDGQGVWSWIHIEDAAAATAMALECSPGAYNIVDADPTPQRVWLPAFARAVQAPALRDHGRKGPRGIRARHGLLYDPTARRLEREGQTLAQFSAAPARMAISKPAWSLTHPCQRARSILIGNCGLIPFVPRYCRGS
jgi:nucleoside-diphosphate-sugar epimerase